MAENPQQQVQLRIDESRMHVTYANTIRTTTTTDEVVLDMGVNLPVSSPDNQPTLQFNIGSRVVLNWRSAKRLAISLGQVIRQFEEANGEIQLNPGQPNKPRIAE